MVVLEEAVNITMKHCDSFFIDLYPPRVYLSPLWWSKAKGVALGSFSAALYFYQDLCK